MVLLEKKGICDRYDAYQVVKAAAPVEGGHETSSEGDDLVFGVEIQRGERRRSAGHCIPYSTSA